LNYRENNGTVHRSWHSGNRGDSDSGFTNTELASVKENP